MDLIFSGSKSGQCEALFQEKRMHFILKNTCEFLGKL